MLANSNTRVLLFVSLAVTASGCARSKNDYVAPPPPEVTVATPVLQDVTLFIEQTGQTEAVQTVAIRSRVSGFLQEMQFTPGQVISADDLLYRIEPDEYLAAQSAAKAAVSLAIANEAVAMADLESAEAELERATSEFEREEKLLKSQASSQAAYDDAIAARDAAAAKISRAKAGIEAAKADRLRAEASLEQADLNVQYTQITSPIDGKITNSGIDLGNLVDTGQILASIVDHRQIYANFSISDRSVVELMNAREKIEEQDSSAAKPHGPDVWSEIPVYLRRETDASWVQGQLDYVDQSGVDASTGTLAMRALVDNVEQRLLPGMFVNIRLPVEELKDAVLVPESAVSRSQMGDFIMVVGDDKKVQQRFIQINQRLDGWAIVQSGIEADDVFVVEGLQRVRPGATVATSQTQLSTQDSPMLQASTEISSFAEDASSDDADEESSVQ